MSVHLNHVSGLEIPENSLETHNINSKSSMVNSETKPSGDTSNNITSGDNKAKITQSRPSAKIIKPVTKAKSLQKKGPGTTCFAISLPSGFYTFTWVKPLPFH